MRLTHRNSSPIADDKVVLIPENLARKEMQATLVRIVGMFSFPAVMPGCGGPWRDRPRTLERVPRRARRGLRPALTAQHGPQGTGVADGVGGAVVVEVGVDV